ANDRQHRSAHFRFAPHIDVAPEPDAARSATGSHHPEPDSGGNISDSRLSAARSRTRTAVIGIEWRTFIYRYCARVNSFHAVAPIAISLKQYYTVDRWASPFLLTVFIGDAGASFAHQPEVIN